ncbi:MAG TPA: hypothetical protein VFK24_05190 [Gammaproteobacteria bacterium]|nr:hypothetical protein [Gammaproteobacteria bacterium]
MSSTKNNSGVKMKWLKNTHIVFFFASLLLATSASAQPFKCINNSCGLITRGNNPNLVVGTVEAVATKAQMRRVLRWARNHGYWKSLPTNASKQLGLIQLLSLCLSTSSGVRSVTVLMMRDEYKASPLQFGALVRYSPHDAAHEDISYDNKIKEAYWLLVGCVAQLCAPGDADCAARYRSGVFNRATGAQLDIATGQPLSHGVLINPLTLLPLTQSN